MEDFDTTDKIIKLNGDDFNDKGALIKQFAKKNARVTIVLFFAPWCGHCYHFKPIYLDVAKKMFNEVVNISSYDATYNDNGSKINKFTDFTIRGFPQVSLFVDGQFKTNYNGARTADALISFIQTNIAQLTNKNSVFSFAMF